MGLGSGVGILQVRAQTEKSPEYPAPSIWYLAPGSQMSPFTGPRF